MKTTIAAFFCSAVVAVAGTIYGPVTFMDEVKLGVWPAVTQGMATVTSANGAFVAGPYTNWYRICGTNASGRLPMSTNILVTFQGYTNGYSNAVQLAWEPVFGVQSYVVLRSVDAGSTWTNWATAGAGATNFIDYGTNTWQRSDFAALYSEIPGGSISDLPNYVPDSDTGANIRVEVPAYQTFSIQLGRSGPSDSEAALNVYDASTNLVLSVTGDGALWLYTPEAFSAVNATNLDASAIDRGTVDAARLPELRMSMFPTDDLQPYRNLNETSTNRHIFGIWDRLYDPYPIGFMAAWDGSQYVPAMLRANGTTNTLEDTFSGSATKLPTSAAVSNRMERINRLVYQARYAGLSVQNIPDVTGTNAIYDTIDYDLYGGGDSHGFYHFDTNHVGRSYEIVTSTTASSGGGSMCDVFLVRNLWGIPELLAGGSGYGLDQSVQLRHTTTVTNGEYVGVFVSIDSGSSSGNFSALFAPTLLANVSATNATMLQIFERR